MSFGKRVSFVTFAVLCALAAVGVGSATATRVCMEEGAFDTCPEKKIYKAGTKVEMFQTGKSKFSFGLTNTCESSTFKGVTETAGGSGELTSVLGLFKEPTWGGCTCATTAMEPPFEFDIYGSGNRDGILDIATEVEFNCSGTKCAYRGEPKMPLEGGNQAKLAIKNATLNKLSGGVLCNATATWEANYLFSEPIPMFVTKN